jgi:hypothetical protein
MQSQPLYILKGVGIIPVALCDNTRISKIKLLQG